MSRRLLVLFVLCCVQWHVCARTGAQSSDENLAHNVIEAAKKQVYRENSGPTSSSIVVQAPTAVLANGDGDISTTGPCSKEREIFCINPPVPPGEGRLARCIRKQIRNEEKGNVTGRRVTDKCKIDVRNFYASRASNINLNLGFASACKEDAAKFCKDSPKPTDGAVISCLRNYEQKLQTKCKTKVFHAKLAAAHDYRVDPDLARACKTSVEKLCSDVADGQGRVAKCLVRMSICWVHLGLAKHLSANTMNIVIYGT
jgi:golgi apparatus protein 1